MTYPRQFHCSDGHDVRSLSEQAIDEWMSTHHVYHEYERLANIPEHLVPDFTVYTKTDHRPVFMEYWGMLDDPSYRQRRLRKCEVYHKHRCMLIEPYQDDLRNLDFSLRTKLKEHGVDVT
jgi:predicted nuclease of restriction endonuclease-like RecB superfamily